MHLDPNFITVALTLGGSCVAIISMYIDYKIDKALKGAYKEWDKDLSRLQEKVFWCERELHIINAQLGKDLDSFIRGKDEA